MYSIEIEREKVVLKIVTTEKQIKVENIWFIWGNNFLKWNVLSFTGKLCSSHQSSGKWFGKCV